MKKQISLWTLPLIVGLFLLGGCRSNEPYVISKATMLDKIKGGWAGQVIGCTYGGPTEFKFKGVPIPEEHEIPWYDDYVKTTFEKRAGLYDDIYMDICFMEVIEKHGMDAPVDVFATTFANADYKLWHANQIARYNILRGIMPPQSGHWMNNPHADDIDFQIEADFVGLMSPGLVNESSKFCDKVGHIMNYGDGYYGGVYVAAMYAQAFVSDSVEEVVTEALKAIPAESRYYKCIANTINLWRKYPTDWRTAWVELQALHGEEDIACGYGVMHEYNIDAALNSAYVVMGLLYGEKDFYKTLDISTRCGQDSDCNPATAGGILGVMLGYDGIGEEWTRSIELVDTIKFPYTESSMMDVYAMGMRHAKQVVENAGGEVTDENYIIPRVKIEPVALEQSFEGLYPVERIHLDQSFTDSDTFKAKFNGTGFIIHGTMRQGKGSEDYVAWFDLYLNGEKWATFDMPINFLHRRYDIYHIYGLPKDEYELELRWTNYEKPYKLFVRDFIYYTDQPTNK